MSTKFRKTLLAGAIAALVSAPLWAQQEIPDAPGAAPQTESGQPMAAPPAGSQTEPYPARETRGMSNPLYSKTPSDLRRGEVIDATGEKVGTIKAVVSDPGHQDIHAVISSGGILGFRAKEILVSFDELQLADDNKVQVTATKQELQERSEYVSGDYVELEADRPISEFSAFEPMHEPEPGALPGGGAGSERGADPGW
jgi:sporulation protein YlmC with PRC-barrel domain